MAEFYDKYPNFLNPLLMFKEQTPGHKTNLPKWVHIYNSFFSFRCYIHVNCSHFFNAEEQISPQLSGSNSIPHLSLTVSVVLEFRHWRADCASMSLMKSQSNICLISSHLRPWMGWKTHFKVAHPMAIIRQPQFLSTRASTVQLEYPQDMTFGFPRERGPFECGSCNTFQDLALKAMHY